MKVISLDNKLGTAHDTIYQFLAPFGERISVIDNALWETTIVCRYDEDATVVVVAFGGDVIEVVEGSETFDDVIDINHV